MIPYGRQDVNQQDIDAVVNVLKSDFLTQGPRVPEFENAVASISAAAHAVAVNSATSALHIACMALGLGPGDHLWTSPITFVASANCGLYCGAEVDFVDIDEKTFNICPNALRFKLQRANLNGKLPKVLVVVHMCGQPANMREIHRVAQEYSVKIIEDASHAIGGKYKQRPIGCGDYSDITVFSFHPVKIITSAEGGMAITNCSDLAEKMRLARSHGITRDPALMTVEADGPWYYQQIDLGFNYRMTELQGALGLQQITRLEEYVAERHRRAKIYDAAFADSPLSTPWRHPEGYSAFHLYVVKLDDASKRRSVFEFMQSKGIGVNVHYIPVHLQPYYQNKGFKLGDYPAAEDYYSRALSIPLFPSMTDNQQNIVIKNLKWVLSS